MRCSLPPATSVGARLSKLHQRTALGDVYLLSYSPDSRSMTGGVVVARKRRQEALLAGMLRTIVGFALLSDLDGFKWSSRNHGLESASISSQSRMKAVRLPVCALASTRRPQSALNLCSHPCAIALIGHWSVAQAHTNTHKRPTVALAFQMLYCPAFCGPVNIACMPAEENISQ